MDQPTFPATFVTARTHLGKTYTDEGSRRPPHAKILTSMEYPLTADRQGVETLAKLVARHTGAGDAFFTGKFRKPLIDESRAGQADSQFRPQVLVVDLDDVAIDLAIAPPFSHDQLVLATEVMRPLLPPALAKATCVAHASSSFGLKPGKVSLHLFFILDAPVLSGQLKAWLAKANFDNDVLADNIRLSPSGGALHFPLDRCTGENSRLIYIASPQFESAVIQDPFPEPVDRVTLVDGETDIAKISDEVKAISPEAADQLIKAKIKDLRKLNGLPTKQARVQTMETRRGEYRDVHTNPDRVAIEVAYEREPFVYANLNGGDSNAYYWPKDNPKYIYNFKDEPIIEMAKAAPDFYRDYLAELAEEAAANVDEVIRPMIVRDEDADTHISFLYHGDDHTLVKPPKKIGNDKDRKDWYIQYGGMAPDHYETWRVLFNPHSFTQLDFDDRQLNTFTPTEYMLLNPGDVRHTYGSMFPALEKAAPRTAFLINHIAGGGRIEVEHFLNWLAYVFQFRAKSNIAWVFHGVEGTGKGLLFNELLVPLFGRYAMNKKLEHLEDGFDGWREECLLAVFDEFRMSDAKDGSRLYDKLKNMISEPSGTIRAMFAEQKSVKLYENLMFFSNSNDALKISVSDRRFCVPPAQNTPIKRVCRPHELVARLAGEVAAFAQYLVDAQVDEAAARTALETEAKAAMRNASNTWVEDFAAALKGGDLGWFLDNAVSATPNKPEHNTLITRAGEAIADIALELLNGQHITYVSLDKVALLYGAIDGGKATKISISKTLSRYGCEFVRRRIDNQRNRFITVNWDIDDLDLTMLVSDYGNPLQQSETKKALQ